MAKDNNKPIDNPTEEESNQHEAEKTVSVAEMQRRLKAAEDKHQTELTELRESLDQQIKEAVSKATMSDEELEALKEKERQDAIQAIEQENAELKAQIAKRQMQDVAIKELESQGIPVNESTLAFVVKDDEDSTKTAVANMANILNAQKREEAVSNPPKSSGGVGGQSSHEGDKFAKAKITQF
ncbi:DUF4355 domain-containing protein [Streptococcus sp. zg-JUN1979]|uniref:capsid assembly scaffolding protein Gp46 family protein n=1 Tax=Streptococcus sp. zg-JUN1979 TaxID=3391450 RepID=UPI0039A51CEF